MDAHLIVQCQVSLIWAEIVLQHLLRQLKFVLHKGQCKCKRKEKVEDVSRLAAYIMLPLFILDRSDFIINFSQFFLQISKLIRDIPVGEALTRHGVVTTEASDSGSGSASGGASFSS